MSLKALGASLLIGMCIIALYLVIPNDWLPLIGLAIIGIGPLIERLRNRPKFKNISRNVRG